MSASIGRFAPVLALVLALLASGCVSWQPTPAPISEVVSRHQGEAIRVTQTNGRRSVILAPTMSDSILFGSVKPDHCSKDVDGTRICRQHPVRVQIPTSEIIAVEVPNQDQVARGAFIGGLGFGALATSFLFAGGAHCSDYFAECAGLVLKTSLVGALWGALMAGFLDTHR